MNYKERMIEELIDLSEKIGRLNDLLDNMPKTKEENEKLERKKELLLNQRDCMIEYRNILADRLILEVN